MVNHTHLARLFLISLVVLALYVAWIGTIPAVISLIRCPFDMLTDIPCPGCGMTRACLALIQGKFADAWGYHPFSFLILALAIGTAFFPTWIAKTWNQRSHLTRNIILISAIVLCMFRWIYKLCM